MTKANALSDKKGFCSTIYSKTNIMVILKNLSEAEYTFISRLNTLLKYSIEYSGQTEPLNPGQTEPVIPGQTEPLIPVKLSHLRV